MRRRKHFLGNYARVSVGHCVVLQAPLAYGIAAPVLHCGGNESRQASIYRVRRCNGAEIVERKGDLHQPGRPVLNNKHWRGVTISVRCGPGYVNLNGNASVALPIELAGPGR